MKHPGALPPRPIQPAEDALSSIPPPGSLSFGYTASTQGLVFVSTCREPHTDGLSSRRASHRKRRSTRVRAPCGWIHRVRAVCAQHKLVMLRETQLAMGRSALVLSGGAAIGCFHIGVVKVLLQRNLLPRVVVGSSAGAIVGVRPPC
jgi:hypothetical protein